MPVHEIRHPLIRHKLSLMRRADLSTKNFREMSQEVAALLTYEATQDLPLEDCTIEGWCGPIPGEKLAGKKVTVVPILRGSHADPGCQGKRGGYRPQRRNLTGPYLS